MKPASNFKEKVVYMEHKDLRWTLLQVRYRTKQIFLSCYKLGFYSVNHLLSFLFFSFPSLFNPPVSIWYFTFYMAWFYLLFVSYNLSTAPTLVPSPWLICHFLSSLSHFPFSLALFPLFLVLALAGTSVCRKAPSELLYIYNCFKTIYNFLKLVLFFNGF